ncbi:hypothetical protein ACHAPG_007362 [Botrytis cinerea]
MAIAGQGPTIVAVMWTETVVALIAIGLRLYTKGFITRNVGFDDYLIIISWFMLMPYTVACTAAATQGFGQHSSDLTIEAFANATRSEIIGQTFCIIGIATSKASASVFLLRLAVVEWHKWVLYITMFAVTGIAIICALFDFIRCDPIAHVWNPYIPAKCWVSTEQFTAISITVGDETIGLILWSSTELMITILTATIPTYRPLYKVLRGSLSSTSGRSGRGYRLDNIEEEGRKDLPPPAVKRRPRNDTTLMATAISDDEHNDYYSDRIVLESSKGRRGSDS